ncbi:hypothetical protein DASC09_052600 [Saccharomycopsis crataegensis]|uniref:Uncharacterized protein n=1 Tax=Saccharomycopsis crataegensis TaxID=43959 RepID=A0AAV5QTL1_9ASCO|nr:hypothetical protein DASC09_052600 [Saccharomycopsis crataegensis]
MNTPEVDFKNQTIARIFNTLVFQKQQLAGSDSNTSKNKKSNSNVRITKNTVHLVNEYLKIFATEAILRSKEQKDQKDQEEGQFEDVEQILDVQDLEAVAGLLVLDF